MPTRVARKFEPLEPEPSVPVITAPPEVRLEAAHRSFMPYVATAVAGLAGSWVVLAALCTIDPGLVSWVEGLI